MAEDGKKTKKTRKMTPRRFVVLSREAGAENTALLSMVHDGGGAGLNGSADCRDWIAENGTDGREYLIAIIVGAPLTVLIEHPEVRTLAGAAEVKEAEEFAPEEYPDVPGPDA